MPETFISDDYLVELASRSLIPMANLVIGLLYGLGSLIFIFIGIWSFNRLAAGNRSLQPNERSKYLWGGVMALIVSGILFSGLTAVDIAARSITSQSARALSTSGDNFTGLATNSNIGFIWGTLYLLGIYLIFTAAVSMYSTTQNAKTPKMRIVVLFAVGGSLVQAEEMSQIFQNTVKAKTVINSNT
ncbi:MAG: hypothetical protein JKY60_03290 [Kordiimonadaceae bacterium]|nr:hypothetical protein [Kordiimonadaceae bacterium]